MISSKDDELKYASLNYQTILLRVDEDRTAKAVQSAFSACCGNWCINALVTAKTKNEKHNERSLVGLEYWWLLLYAVTLNCFLWVHRRTAQPVMSNSRMSYCLFWYRNASRFDTLTDPWIFQWPSFKKDCAHLINVSISAIQCLRVLLAFKSCDSKSLNGDFRRVEWATRQLWKTFASIQH